MKKILALLLAAVLCLGLMSVAFAEDAPVTTIDSTLQLGDTVPNFTVTLEDGTVFTLSEALETHKAVMVNIWATWCHYCVAEMPAMQQAYANYGDDVALICLSPSDANEDITSFKQANDLQLLPMGFDSVDLTTALAVQGFPTTVIIDRFGKLAFYHSGYFTDTVMFTRIWDYYTSDDYTETVLMEDVPVPQYEGEYPTDEELTAALCADGSVSFTYDHEDEDLWPFVVNDQGAVNSNALEIDATASLAAEVTAKAGDVFAFDYDADLETFAEALKIYVNGEAAAPIYFTGKTTWAYEFTEDGDYEIDFIYTEAVTESSTDAAGTVQLSNARLLSGKDAEAVLASLPVYTATLQGEDFDIELLTENAEQIVINCPAGATISDLFGSDLACYIVPEDTCSFRMLVGDELDATNAMALAVTDGRAYYPVAALDADDEGYPFDVCLSCVEDGGNSYNAVVMYGNAFPSSADDFEMKGFVLFRNEENVNSFLQMIFSDDDGNLIEGTSWTYADGTQPSTTECAQLAEADTFRYNITIVDENGDPVNGCMINICSDSNCCPQMLKDTNCYSFNGIDDQPYAYIIHVLKVPEGYSFDTTTAFTLNADGDTLTITVPHA